MVNASHCVGLTFPGMILLPGSFSGKASSPNPHRGPEPRYRISLAIFINETATVFKAPCASTKASCAASASNCIQLKSVQAFRTKSVEMEHVYTLLGAVLNSRPVILEISAATLTSKPFLVFRPCKIALSKFTQYT